jgi:carboxypeptidase C (cathepsin A)
LIRVLKRLLYTAKHGAKALSATTVVVSYALNGTSHVIAGMSYIPHGASKILEEIKEEDKNTVEYKIITSSQNLLDLTSGVIYAASYIPYSARKVLYKASLSPEKIEQIYTKSDLFVDNLSSKLKGIKTENFSQALAVAY